MKYFKTISVGLHGFKKDWLIRNNVILQDSKRHANISLVMAIIVQVGNTMMDMYIKFDSIGCSAKVFESMSIWKQSSWHFEALEMFWEVQKQGIKVDMGWNILWFEMPLSAKASAFLCS